ncbi:hypothetical protein EJ06DRAFT_527063 [Trichodelitschia bisporula]|uniref:Uncharacterized protein n=1 Tax=Trichodelitschia bisporula TaxID=703511 RepID=A0A6G1I561_9PEZI|nr:hypothetical protein EJ06DRAFT_527063 [Trichodelitschia bisporula]
MDHSIRTWNLHPDCAMFPCSTLLDGQGHKSSVASVGFHRTGQYLLSSGMDTIINMWVLPEDIHKLPKPPSEERGNRELMKRVHFPHFSSAEIHSDYVDCVKFYGDLIVSRASKENRILLWKIDGFDSDSDPPSPDVAPTGPDSTGLRDTQRTPLLYALRALHRRAKPSSCSCNGHEWLEDFILGSRAARIGAGPRSGVPRSGFSARWLAAQEQVSVGATRRQHHEYCEQ